MSESGAAGGRHEDPEAAAGLHRPLADRLITRGLDDGRGDAGP